MKKATMRNFKKFLSIICSLALVLGVSIPALTVSAAGFGEAPFAYPNPIIPSSSTTVFNFDNASEYAVANQENALYLSYYNGYGGTTVPSGTTAEITDGKLKFSSGVSSGESIQSWVINKNGAPYELIPGHSYTVTFDFEQTGTVALTNVNGPFVSLSAGIATHDWTFKAKYGDKTYSLGAAASVMPTAGNYTYDGGLIANNARENRNIANNAVVNANINKVMHGYKGWPSAGNVKTVSYSFVAYYMNDTRVKNYLAFTFGLNAGQAFTIDNFKIIDNDFVRETDTLTAENDSITYDFANADDYVLDNSGDEAYWTRYYGRPQSSYTVTDGVYSTSKVIVPVENDLSVENGSLKLNSGLDDVDFSGYSTSNSLYSEPDKRSIISWVVNKNGKPIELVPGMDYTVTVKYKNYTAGDKYTFVSLSNGVAKDDVNGTYWWSDFGASASVMSDSKAYTYIKAQTNPSTAGVSTYPNNAAFAFDYDIAKDNHIIGMAANKTVTSSTTVTKSFLAYDITENGTNAKRNNYLALTFCLCQGQTVEIEEITVTYNYSKVTNVTYDFGDGTTKSVIETVGAEFSEIATKEGHQFVCWKDEEGTVYETVPQVDGGKLTVYPVFETTPTVLEDLGQNKIEFDFTNSNEYQLINSDAVSNKYLSYYRPATGSSTANDTTGSLAYASSDLRTAVIDAQEAGETVQIVEDSENNNKKVLKLTSGLPSGAAQTTIQSWVINKNGKPIELEPGEYYDISVSYRQAKKSSLARNYTFISLSNGIAYDSANQYHWSDFGATASVMSEKEGATYSYTVGGDSIHTVTTTAYPNSAVSLWNKNYNSVMWTDADDVYSSSYTTHKNTYKAYDITEDGTLNRKNYLALTFALSADQEIYIDTITVTKVNKITYDTYGIDETLNRRFAACGENITLPVAQANDGEQFIAWSTDDAGSNSLAELFTMPADDVTLYAIYDSAEVTVDPYMYEIIDSCENIEYDENDNFSVVTGSEQAKFAIPNGGGSGNYNVASGRAYKISFEYQLVGNSDVATINAYTVKLGDVDYKEANSYALKATSSEEWQNGELIVVLSPDYYIADGQYCLANALFLGVDGIDSTATCKFANIVVTVLDEPILTVDYNLGDNKVEHKTNTQLDTPEKEGFVFGGWYDSLSQETFTATELADDTTVYADWITEYVLADVNYDGEFNIIDLVRLKKIASGMYDDEVINKRGEINGDYSYAQNLTLLRKVLLTDSSLDEIQKTIRVAGININNYCVVYEDGTNVLLNDAVASLNNTLGNPAANDTFKIVISNDSDKAEGIFVDGANLVVNSTDDAIMISLVNHLSRTITRYNGKYHLGFNADVNYGNSTLNKSEYALVFGDEFDAEGLSNYWATSNKTTEGVYEDANGTQVKTYRIENSDEVLVDNGFATLTNEAVLNADGTQYFKNQNLCSDFSFTYGYLETRVKIADSPATTALWLRGTSSSPETNFVSEFDMCETYTDDHTIHANMHAFGPNGQHYALDQSGSEFVDDGILDWDVKDKDYESSEGNNGVAWSADFHVFAVKWDAEGVTYYLDGKEYFTYTFDDSFLGKKSDPEAFRQPVNLLISTAMGSYNYGPVWTVGDLASANVEIDYVRLYQSELDGGNLNGIIK